MELWRRSVEAFRKSAASVAVDLESMPRVRITCAKVLSCNGWHRCLAQHQANGLPVPQRGQDVHGTLKGGNLDKLFEHIEDDTMHHLPPPSPPSIQ